jgi:hypothetical protein
MIMIPPKNGLIKKLSTVIIAVNRNQATTAETVKNQVQRRVQAYTINHDEENNINNKGNFYNETLITYPELIALF